MTKGKFTFHGMKKVYKSNRYAMIIEETPNWLLSLFGCKSKMFTVVGSGTVWRYSPANNSDLRCPSWLEAILADFYQYGLSLENAKNRK